MNPTTADRATTLLSSPEAEGLWAPLHADGYAVDVADHESIVTVTVQAGATACADCLAPSAVLHDIVRLFLEDHGVPTAGLTLRIVTPAEAG